MEKHPQLYTVYKLFTTETQPFRKVHRMIDLFESIIKMHTVVIMAEYFLQTNSTLGKAGFKREDDGVGVGVR
jgi:hypothetical protein